jgi:flagellin-specific chaperone FliS
MKEKNFDTLQVYLESLQVELIGSQNLIKVLRNDVDFISLLSILEYFINNKDISNVIYKREVFKCINIIKKLKSKYKNERC